MSDDKSERGQADRLKIDIHEAYEVEYWSRELGLSPDQLCELIAKHGVMVADVRRVLGKVSRPV